MFGIVDLADEAGDDVDAGLQCELLRLDLVAHRGDRIYRRSDEGDIFLGERLGKAGAFGQEAIARMHRLGAGRLARGDDLVGDQIGFGRRRRPDMHRLIGHLHKGRARVGVRIDRDGSDAHAARGLDDAAGDFAAIGDQDFLEHGPQYSSIKSLSCFVRASVNWVMHPLNTIGSAEPPRIA